MSQEVTVDSQSQDGSAEDSKKNQEEPRSISYRKENSGLFCTFFGVFVAADLIFLHVWVGLSAEKHIPP